MYREFGLSVGTIVQGLSRDDRRAAYACDITYASSKEIAFDYLRDRISHGLRPRPIRSKLRRAFGDTESGERPVMRGLHFAIVDEADSVLIDEARTPLIISRATEVADERRFAEDAFRLIEDLSPGRDYRVVREDRRIELTDAGVERLATRGSLMGGHWQSRIRREEAARQALTALVLFHRGDQYLVREGRVEIIDEYTGRVMKDRSWSDGLHQLVEAKEGCEITSRKLPVARMTFQRFFRRYKRLGGMTGTAREAKREFWTVYKLSVRRVPPNVPSQRVNRGLSICQTETEKWLTIRRRINEVLSDQRAVLVGTRSVAASQKLSDLLLEAGIQHAVLNAEDDRNEASIIAAAGQVGWVTVATNMAGRGVDIKLTQALAERGGLHVILSERHDAKRIDRQLKGRAGRQGEQGSTEEILSLQDPLLDLVGGHPLRLLAKLPGGRVAAQLLFRRAQLRAERSHFRMRKDLLAEDRRIGTLLAFTGGHE